MGGDGTGTGNAATANKCGLMELLIFVAAIIAGTACSICSKTMMELHGVGITGEMEQFSKPLFQTFGMFVGMTFGLVMHFAVLFFRIPFPGYDFGDDNDADPDPDTDITTTTATTSKLEKGQFANEKDPLIATSNNATATTTTQETSTTTSKTSLPLWMYFFLAIPSVFDLLATILCMCGLRYIDVSIYQMLRGSGIIFVALMKQHVLGDKLYQFQWAGVFGNVASVIFVGATAILSSSSSNSQEDGGEIVGDDGKGGEALLGVMLVMAGAFVQSLQFVFEEKVMTMDIPSPPLLLIGMEGLWGTILCVFVMYPLAYYLPGDDHGSYEDPFNTMAMIQNSKTIQIAFAIYFFAIFFYNLFAVLVTFLLNSVWHAILDNFRPITVWSTDLFIYYVIVASSSTMGGGDMGEPWTKWSYVQLAGMGVLFYGTAVYNAPNAGSIKLQGQWWAFGLNFTKEYDALHEEELDAEWEEKRENLKQRKMSSFYGVPTSSPHISLHTQALYGLAAQHN